MRRKLDSNKAASRFSKNCNCLWYRYMAPEVLSSEVYPESDVWAAGVMCYQLLSGFFPFDDKKNRRNPSLSLVWYGGGYLDVSRNMCHSISGSYLCDMQPHYGSKLMITSRTL